MVDFAHLRAAMVNEQLAPRGIREPRLLAAMGRVPREAFVSPESVGEAYADRALAIGLGQTISQPYMVAAMTEALEIRSTDRVLEIGTGSGYQTAILAELAARVTSVERRPELAELARARLAALHYSNIEVLVGDGSLGWPEHAPFDAILVAAAAPRVPPSLAAQLANEGRLVVPVGPAAHQYLTVVRRAGAELHESAREGCVFVPLIGAEGWSTPM